MKDVQQKIYRVSQKKYSYLSQLFGKEIQSSLTFKEESLT